MRFSGASIVVKVAHCKAVQKPIRISQSGKQESAMPGPAEDTGPGTVKGQACAAPTLFRYIGNQGIIPTLKLRLEKMQRGFIRNVRRLLQAQHLDVGAVREPENL